MNRSFKENSTREGREFLINQRSSSTPSISTIKPGSLYDITQIGKEEHKTSLTELNPINCINISDFLETVLPEREILLSPWLPKQSLSMIYAWRGICKTWFTICLAYAIACAGEILGWKAPEKRRVLYIDGELPAATLQQRLAMIVNSFNLEPLDKDAFKIITPDLQPDGIVPNLAHQMGSDLIDEIAQDFDLIVVDNLSTLVRGGKENEGESWLPIQEWALQHRSQGRSIIFVHHSGKDSQQSGTSRKEDVLDTVISLKGPPDYNAAEGARFELHFEKSRNLTGNDALPLEVKLRSDNDKIEWEYGPASNGNIDRIQALAKNGASRREICKEMGISRDQLNRVIKKEEGLGREINIRDSRKKN